MASFKKTGRWTTAVLGGAALLSGLGTLAITAAPRVGATADAPVKQIRPVDLARATERHVDSQIRLCQVLSPASPTPIPNIDCVGGNCQPTTAPGKDWNVLRPDGFQVYGQGEYVGRAREQHVPEYRLRVDDQLECIYRLTREETDRPYQINVGDVIRVESFTDKNLDRELIVQPDGTITLRLLGQVRATRMSVQDLREHLDELYQKYYKVPAITVTPIKVNTKLEDLRATVDSRQGFGGQGRQVRVTPEGTIALPALGSLPAQGLTLMELKREIDERYKQEIEGIEVTPILTQRAPRSVFVLGEVRAPGRFDMQGPTTVMQAIAMAGSWTVGAKITHVVVFRRAEDWRLIATKLDLRPALLGKQSCPASEIWVSDADLVIVPKGELLLSANFIELVFTRGLYGVVPPQIIGAQITRSAFTARP